MADGKRTDPTVQGKRRRWWPAVVTVALVAAFAAGIGLWSKRAPIAERLVRDRLAALGLPVASLRFSTLTPWRVAIDNLRLAEGAAVRRVTVDLDWPGLERPEVRRLTVSGLRLTVGVSAAGVDWRGLAPLLARKDARPDEGAADGLPDLPEIDIRDALIEIDTPQGRFEAAVAAADLAVASSGAWRVEGLDADLLHPLGQVTVSGRAGQSAGRVVVDLTLEDGEATVPLGGGQSWRLARLDGAVAYRGALAALPQGTGTVDLTVGALSAPQGVRAKGRIVARLVDGGASLTADLADPGLGLRLAAGATSEDPTAADAIVSLRLEAAARELAVLAPAVETAGSGVSGQARVEATANAGIADLVALAGVGDPLAVFSRLHGLVVDLALKGLRHPAVPGAWDATARIRPHAEGKDLHLAFDGPATVTGDLDGAAVTGSLAGAVDLDPAAGAADGDLTVEAAAPALKAGGYRVAAGAVTAAGHVAYRDGALTYRPAGCDRLAAGAVSGPAVRLQGPLALCLRAGGEGPAVTADKVGGFAIDLAAAPQTPMVRVTAGGRTVTAVTKAASLTLALSSAAGADPKGRAALRGLGLSLPEAQVAADGVDFSASSAGGNAWDVAVTAAALRHLASVPAVAPLALTAKGRWTPKALSLKGTARQEASGLIAALDLSRDNRTGRGEARADLLPMEFGDGGATADAVSPLLATYVSRLTGTVQASAVVPFGGKEAAPTKVTARLGDLAVTPASRLLPPAARGLSVNLGQTTIDLSLPPAAPAEGAGRVTMAGGSVTLGATKATGLATDLRLTALWPPVSAAGQRLTAATIASLVALGDAQVDFALRPVAGGPGLAISRAVVRALGGTVTVDDVMLAAGRLPDKLSLRVDGIDLAELAGVTQVAGLKAEGRVSGRVPLEIDPQKGVAIRQGLLAAVDKGLLAFNPPTAGPGTGGENKQMQLALDVLKDLRFDGLSVTLDGEADKEVRAVLHFTGRNPSVQKGRPVDLTITLTGNLIEAVRAELKNFDLEGLTTQVRGKNGGK